MSVSLVDVILVLNCAAWFFGGYCFGLSKGIAIGFRRAINWPEKHECSECRFEVQGDFKMFCAAPVKKHLGRDSYILNDPQELNPDGLCPFYKPVPWLWKLTWRWRKL